jgi:mediator of RNA polymerase II transcription subunit 7
MAGQPLAEDPDQRVQQLYPPPPPYYRLAERGLEPPPPIEGDYTQFGVIYSTEEGLPPLSVRRLYEIQPDGCIDCRGQLLALHRELMVAFLELLAVLAEAPSGYARQVESVGLVLRNMLHVSNQLRPRQARAELVETLRSQGEERRRALERLRSAKESADDALRRSIGVLQSRG